MLNDSDITLKQVFKPINIMKTWCDPPAHFIFYNVLKISYQKEFQNLNKELFIKTVVEWNQNFFF